MEDRQTDRDRRTWGTQGWRMQDLAVAGGWGCSWEPPFVPPPHPLCFPPLPLPPSRCLYLFCDVVFVLGGVP